MSETSLQGDGKPVVFLVDDQPYYHEIVKTVIGDFCSLIALGDGESALMAAAETPPNLILLDVEMPGMGGYDTCRRFKQNAATVDVPVLFFSVHDEIEDRMKGYEAGGQDYITKPFNMQELKAKVLYLLEQFKRHAELKSIVDSAASTTMTAMTSMGELGVLLDLFRRLNSCTSCFDLAKLVASGISEYGLHGVVRVRILDEKRTISGDVQASPLEESIMDRFSQMETVVGFKSRLAVTYEHVSLLINDMPVADAERCGRLRDHLVMLAEAANVRVGGIVASQQESNLRKTMVSTAQSITDTLSELDVDQRRIQDEIRAVTSKLTEDIESSLLKFGLSQAQEQYLLGIVNDGVGRVIALQLDERHLQDKLADIIQRLSSGLKG